MIKIIQWNNNGYNNNFNEQSLLINEYSPDIIAIQETHIPQNTSIITQRLYEGYFYNLPNVTTSKQGIGIIVKKTYTS